MGEDDEGCVSLNPSFLLMDTTSLDILAVLKTKSDLARRK